MRTRYIRNLKEEQHPHHIGTKAHALGFLLKRGYRVPPTWVCTWDAFSRIPQRGCEHNSGRYRRACFPDAAAYRICGALFSKC